MGHPAAFLFAVDKFPFVGLRTMRNFVRSKYLVALVREHEFLFSRSGFAP